VAGHAVGSLLVLLEVVGKVLLVLVLSVYWTSGRDSFERLWLSLLPSRRRQAAQTVWIATRRNVGSHLRRDLVSSVLLGVTLLFGLRAVGCELFGLATTFVLVLRLFPLLGGAAAVLSVLVIAAPSGPVAAIASTALTLALLLVLRLVVAPRALRVERNQDPILAVLVIVALAANYGVPGLIAAPFVAVAVQTLVAEVIALRASEADLPTIAELGARAERLERRFRWTPPSPAIASLLSRLQYLLERAASR
jgi:predicted PurR-regulated permease PerM